MMNSSTSEKQESSRNTDKVCELSKSESNQTFRIRITDYNDPETVESMEPRYSLRPKKSRSMQTKSDTKMEDLLLTNHKRTRTKRISKKKEKFSLSCVEIEKLKKCNSKAALRKILIQLTPEWKRIIKFYMTECFIHDLYTRRLENKMFLLSKRELLYRLIDNPELLTMDCHFDNNLLKNFCTGIANFVTKHYSEISKILDIEI